MEIAQRGGWIHHWVLQDINCTVNGLEIIVNVGSHSNSRKKNKIKSTLKILKS
jgi:hypothetical protein